MILTLNNFTVNDPSTANGVFLDEPIDGLGLPPIRTSSGNYSGRDGGYVSAQFYGSRLVTLTGRFFASSPAALETTRKAFAAALAQPTVAMTITTNGGAQYLLNCYVDSVNMPINRSQVSGNFMVTLIAPDPTIYDNSAGGAMSVQVRLSSGGGITWPITWPITWSGGGGGTTVNNTGNVVIYPVITLTGQMSNPTITNQTTGAFFALTGLTTAPTDVLVIDMYNRTVLLNGGSVLPKVTSPSSWWALLPGSNTVALTSTNSSDTVVATVQWRSGVRGI